MNLSRVEAYVRENLQECAQELCILSNTGVLPQGKVRFVRVMLREDGVPDSEVCRLAERLVEFACLQAVAKG